ncbi:MAG: TonB-dependent receptor [Acidobacteria bacterium]|nr:TonB-dependent receptor [Acidobacteriota bacterium]
MSVRNYVCFFLFIAFAVEFAGSAQTVSGTLSGRITDQTRAVIPGVAIAAKNELTGTMRDVLSNEQGYYVMSFLPLGTYEVTISLPGFQTIKKTGVPIELNNNTVLDFVMLPAGVTETVDVSAEVPLIETTTGDLKYSLDSRAIENTPLAGRNFVSLVEQIPGFQNAPFIGSSNNPTNSTGSYASFSGLGSRQTTFQIDGVNNDDSSENQNRQNVNVSAIQAFQVLTNAFSAEFGRAGGAVVLVQTKSGTNKFHGDVYNFLQNDFFNANGFFSNQRGIPRQPVRRNQYGWTLGGPIIRERLFFFHSGERVSSVGKRSITRFTWLPGDGPRPCAPGEVAAPGGPYCLDPDTHPNMARDLEFIRSVMALWDTPELRGKEPNDPIACADMIASGRPNRCVTINNVGLTFPDSDYSGKLDGQIARATNFSLRYQYSRQKRDSGRTVLGDNFGRVNNRQYNVGYTMTHVFSPKQTGEFRFGFGNRSTLQDVTDGNHIPIIRFNSVLVTANQSGTVIGTSGNVPINRRQRDYQFVYNHSLSFTRHTVRTGTDTRYSVLDDIVNNFHRGFWTFGSLDSTASILAGRGFTGWENLLRGFVTGFQRGYGHTLAENRFKETNLYFQDDWRVRSNLTLNFGIRYEGVASPKEKENRFQYGFNADVNNVQPRFGFAWQPMEQWPGLGWLMGRSGDLVIRGGYGITHSRIFQSIFSQSGANLRSQPPSGSFVSFGGLCRSEVSDPSCGFTFAPGPIPRTTPGTLCNGDNGNANGVRVLCGQAVGSLLQVDPDLQLPSVQQWNFTVERQLPGQIALQLAYSGNRGIGSLFYDGYNESLFPIVSPLVQVDVGGGVFRPVVFDRVCTDFTDSLCLALRDGAFTATNSGALRAFAALTSATASLEEKGIVIENGVPHGYISLSTPRYNERRPDSTFVRNLLLRNFGWSYYNSFTAKLTKKPSRGLSLTASWTWSKAIDTGSEATFTGVDTNSPTGPRNRALSNRGLSAFHAAHRGIVSYSYELPGFRNQQGAIGKVLGGWRITGVTTFQSGNPFSVVAGYDVNLDGVGGDRPGITDPSFLYTSIDAGRALSSCPTAVASGVPCPNTVSETQLPGAIFIPGQLSNRNTSLAELGGQSIPLAAGTDGSGAIGRNTFFAQGLHNYDMVIWKSFRIREGWGLQLRMEWYNLFNRTTFDVPSRTVLSSVPIGRISSQRNPFNYVNAAREAGSRMGQIALRLTF